MASDSTAFFEALKNDRNKKNKPEQLFIKAEGRYTLRILPNKKNPNDVPYFKIWIHFNFFHPNYNTPTTLRCIGKDCPLCEYAKKKEKAKDPNAWKYQSTIMFLYYITDSKNKFHYIKMSATAQNAIFNALTAKAKGGVNPTDINNGRLAVLSLDKSSGKNKFKCDFMNEVHKVSQDISDKLEMAPSLNEIYRLYKKEDLEKIVRGEKLVFTLDSEDQQESQQQEEKKGPTVLRLYDSEDADTQRKVTIMEEAKRKINGIK
jgi:hypothetical protein